MGGVGRVGGAKARAHVPQRTLQNEYVCVGAFRTRRELVTCNAHSSIRIVNAAHAAAHWSLKMYANTFYSVRTTVTTVARIRSMLA